MERAFAYGWTPWTWTEGPLENSCWSKTYRKASTYLWISILFVREHIFVDCRTIIDSSVRLLTFSHVDGQGHYHWCRTWNCHALCATFSSVQTHHKCEPHLGLLTRAWLIQKFSRTCLSTIFSSRMWSSTKSNKRLLLQAIMKASYTSLMPWRCYFTS